MKKDTPMMLPLSKRPVAPDLDDVLLEPFPVLDKGFVRVIDYMGNDASVVQAARVSYGQGTKRVRDDARLINYLMRNGHTSPFEMCEIKLHIKLPIFVARQWIRHRTASVNEYSARYSVLDNEFYLPDVQQLAKQSISNKQGKSDALDAERAAHLQELLRSDAERAFASYGEMLDNESGESGLARELARIGLPLSVYTQWYWKTNLHNFLNFIALRNDNHAQWEIRQYAHVLLGLLERWTPIVAKAFHNYRVAGARISAEGLSVLRRVLAGGDYDRSAIEMSDSEWREFCLTVGLSPS